MNKITSVCVYCASSTKIDSAYFEAARELGTLLGQRHIRLINGAGGIGLMSATADAVLAAGGEVTGVIPHFMVEQGWQHKGLTEMIEVENMHQRKQKMADLSDAVIALPGGCGTLEELLEIITWKQLGLYLNPIVILNTNGFFDPPPGYVAACYGRKLYETAAWCHLARSKHSAGSRRTDSYHTCLG